MAYESNLYVYIEHLVLPLNGFLQVPFNLV